ncbi:MAG TPA: tetratricopeptide repeat protein [Solirubrobacteraceae bacterium]|nr:tetratricopeptide repeat protein [Solirubrobacteraceae bacterium]
MSLPCRSLAAALAALAVLALLSPLAPGAAASERAHALDGSEVSPWDRYFLRRTNPITFQPGLGAIAMDVTTRSSEARSWFNQGLAQLFGFAHEDAIYSFDRALAHDPNLAMAYWGRAWAYGANINLDADFDRARKAYENFQAASARAASASPREQAYIRALDGRYEPGVKPYGPAPRGDRDEEFFLRMVNDVMNRYPADLHAATFAAEAGLDLNPWNQWSKDGRPRKHTRQIVAILERVLALDPHHVGAQHYYVHAVEASPVPDDALLAAQRMKSDAFGQPHLVHAASHIYARDGDWGSAQVSGQDAEYQDELYLQRNGINNLYTIAHGSHNIHFEASVMSMGGRRVLAIANARELRLKVTPFLDDLPAIEFYQPYEILMRTRFADWDGVLAMPEPPSHLLGARALRHYARGVAYAETGREEAASRELASLIGLRNRIRQRRPEYPEFNLNPVPAVLAVAERVLAGRIRWHRGDRDLALRLFGQAVRLEDELHYDEPPPWYFPTGELLGAALLRSGRPNEAEAAFRAVLRDYPGDGWALFGLVESLRAQGAPTTAVALAERAFARAWRWADTPLTIGLLL